MTIRNVNTLRAQPRAVNCIRTTASDMAHDMTSWNNAANNHYKQGCQCPSAGKVGAKIPCIMLCEVSDGYIC